MKFKLTSACLYNDGTHGDEGEVIEVSKSEASNLYAANRGYPVAPEPPAPTGPVAPEPPKAKK